MTSATVRGRLVLEGGIAPGHVIVEGDRIARVVPNERAMDGPLILPGFVDLHVHGCGGFDAMGSESSLDGMARALLRHGVTSFLPTAVTAPMESLRAFGNRISAWTAHAPEDGAAPLGFNLEGPFISPKLVGAQNPAFVVAPDDVPLADLEPLIGGLRLTTVAPEAPGALTLIRWLDEHGVKVSLGHSVATATEAEAGFDAGATSSTHLFNAMSRIDHHQPGLAVVALTRDDTFVELIADGHHVDRRLWPLIRRAKPPNRLVLVSDGIELAGTTKTRGKLGLLEVEVHDGRCTLVSNGGLAGSVIALDTAVRNLAASGVDLHLVSMAASTNPAALIGAEDRGRIVAGLRADLVELDNDFHVRRVMRGGLWFAAAPSRSSRTATSD
jgi:N-acetylglucosamine-6-phosphate deacetylase